MLLYNLRIAIKSLRRNVVHSLLIVAGIALGIAVSGLVPAVRHAFAKDPIPEKSAALHYVRLDSWDPLKPHPSESGIPPQITYQDMTAIMKSDIPVRQSGMYKANLYVFPDPKVGRPRKALVRMCFSDFFPMFDVPFKFGSGWDKKADQEADSVVVIGAELNDELFGGRNSVGQTLRIETRDFRVVGVLDHWRPGVKFYDLTQNFVQPPEPLFMPFNLLRPMRIGSAGNQDGWKSAPAPGLDGLLASEGTWIQMWVELPTPEKVAAYQDFLRSYVLEQKKTGRFPRPINNRVTPLIAWMGESGVVPEQVTALTVVSLLFLAVCSLNLMGLLLAKFLARAPEVGVRRALGASRKQVFLQHVVECELVGVVGGALGMLLSLAAVAAANGWVKTMMQRSDLI